MTFVQMNFRHSALTFVLLITLAIPAIAQDQWKNIYSESAWNDRDVWQKAPELIRRLELKPGSDVADIGCHEGYMTIKLANAVGPTGHVFAVDLEENKLELLRSNLAKRNITHVNVIKGEPDDPKLPAETLDAVIILDTYHEIRAHQKTLEHIRDALKANGRLVICEPIADERKDLTREEQQRKHEVGMTYVMQDLKAAGFKITRQQAQFVDRKKEKGDIMWLLVAVKF